MVQVLDELSVGRQVHTFVEVKVEQWLPLLSQLRRRYTPGLALDASVEEYRDCRN